MPGPSQGTLEIDQTLRLARDAVERDIARYRIVVFGSILVVTGLMRLGGLSDIWLPTFFFGAALVYAVLVRWVLAHRGNPPALALVALVLDLGACIVPFLLVTHGASQAARETNATFIRFIAGPAMILTLLISALRNSTTAAVVGSVVAVVFYVTVVPGIAGFHPGEISVNLMLLLAGVIGVASAIQARKNLESFARLQLLRRFLPPEAVERVMRDDPDAALSLGGRLVTVTLLAADLRGFTAMSENHAPGDVMAQLNAYHGAMIDVIEQHGGTIDKFIGDGTLVVFGLTGSAEDAARAAVACAEAMLGALAVHNADRARTGASALAMGIGVHTGPVIAGNLGVPGRRLEFTVIGDAVNTASRLEGQTKVLGTPVVVSGETVALLPNRSGLKELAPVSLRGKVHEMRVYGLASVPTIAPPPGGS